MEAKLNRREFLRGAALTAVGMLAASCAQPTPQVIEKQVPVEKIVKETVLVEKQVPVEKTVKETVVVEKEKVVEKVVTATPVPSKYKEAPALAELVKAGKLPPVDQRLPSEPLVLEPQEKIGKYGGSWMFMGMDKTFGEISMSNHENFFKYTRDVTAQRPNLLTKFAWNADATEITLYFRKGIKWSDGQPLTANDWVWWWDNMVNDPKVGVAPPLGTKVADTLMKITKVDDYTLKCSFAAANSLFMPIMTRGQGARASSYQLVPSHYFKKLHYKFNTALKDTDVAALQDQYNNRMNYVGIPTMAPWVVKELLTGQKAILERNPYYWKVDTQGNQLPYLDTLEYRVANTKELIILSCVNGEVDFQLRNLATDDLPVLKENEAKGKYKIQLWKAGTSNLAGIIINYCYEKDKGIRDLLWNQKFRQALQWSTDKQRIVDIVFLGMARPLAIACLAEGMEFSSARGQKVLKDWETQGERYDAAASKKLLDEIGVVDKDKDGFREKPDGSKLELIIDAPVDDPTLIKVMQLVVEDWAKIGIKGILNVIDSTLMVQRVDTCEGYFRARGGAASGLITAPAHWTPVEDTDYCICGWQYGKWYQTKGKQGIAPPPGSFIEKLQKCYGDAIMIADDAKRNDRVLDAYQIHIDEGPVEFMTVGYLNVPVLIKNNLHNVPSSGLVFSWTYGEPATADPEMWWKD